MSFILLFPPSFSAYLLEQFLLSMRNICFSWKGVLGDRVKRQNAPYLLARPRAKKLVCTCALLNGRYSHIQWRRRVRELLTISERPSAEAEMEYQSRIATNSSFVHYLPLWTICPSTTERIDSADFYQSTTIIHLKNWYISSINIAFDLQ